MSKVDFIPHSDHDFLIWLDHYLTQLEANSTALGVTAQQLAALKAGVDAFRADIILSTDAQATAKQATAKKNASRHLIETLAREPARQIKVRSDYSTALGMQLGIEGAEHIIDFSNMKPVLTAVDQTGGVVALSYVKNKSDGVHIYGIRDDVSDWVLVGRSTVSPFLDNRRLLKDGKGEDRRYCAVYMLKDTEVGLFSDEVVISCSP